MTATLLTPEAKEVLRKTIRGLRYLHRPAVLPHFTATFAPVAQFAAMLRGTSKPLIMVPESATDIDLFHEMAGVCGAADSWALYAMPTPPLVHGEHSAARLVRCAELGVPMVYATAVLLLVIVVLLNLTAIIVRNRLRKKYKTSAFA